MKNSIRSFFATSSLIFLIGCGGGSDSGSDDMASQFKQQQQESQRGKNECLNHYKYVTHVEDQYYDHYYFGQSEAYSVWEKGKKVVILPYVDDWSRGTNPKTGNKYKKPSGKCRYKPFNKEWKVNHNDSNGIPMPATYYKLVVEDGNLIQYTKYKSTRNSPYQVKRAVFAIPVRGPGNNDYSTLKR